MPLKRALVAVVFLLFIFNGTVEAQIRVVPMPQVREKTEHARLKDVPPLTLPFWDDFSMSNFLLDSVWANHNCVTVNNFIGVDAPTINVATFNGVDATGKPYSSSPVFGKIDSLESMPIDLSTLSEPQRESLYLSFFWQAKGLGDKPNPTDSLRLLFKSNLENWYTQWIMVNDDPKKEIRFNQAVLKVRNNQLGQGETFFHDNFQFRFQAFGNQGGDYDNWHIDYVYLNHGRHALDTVYQDEALTTPPSSLFKPYYSLPLKALLQNPEQYLARPKVQYRNLTNVNVFPQLSAEVNVLEDNNFRFLDLLLQSEPLGVPEFPKPGEIRWLENIINPLNQEKLLLFSDSSGIVLETKVFISTNDPVNSGIDPKVNDTVYAYTHLRDYYAYDDGSAEASLGIDRQGGRIAYMYVISGQDTLTDVDIYFPNFSSGSSSTTIKLQIWKTLGATNPLYQETYPVQFSNSLNELKRYKLTQPLIVNDTFYIGYEQNVNRFLSIGYDRNTDSSDKLFYYVDLNQGWVPYHDTENPSAGVVKGSLMMRPIFGDNTITSIGRPWDRSNINIYPNPSRGIIYIEGDFQEANIKIIDAYGRLIRETTSLNIDLQNLPSGMYLVTVITRKGTYSRKIILQ